MSAAQNKRKPNSDGFGFDKSAKKKNDSSTSTAKVAAITVVVIAVLFFAALFINSNFFRQNLTAVKIDDAKYSITDFNYYYNNMYMQYYSSISGSGLDSMLPSKDTLKSEIYDEDSGETWADFFEEVAFEQMKADNLIYQEAMKAGYQLTDEDKSNIEDDISNMEMSGFSNGYTKLSDFLKAVYGRSMTEDVYRKNLERTYLVSSYTNHMRDSFTYTPEEIEAYYQENKDNFDTFTYRYFLVVADDVNESDYADDDAALQEAKDAAVEAAGEKANAIAAGISDEESFIAAAREYDPETYKDDDATQRTYKGELLGSTYGDWMKEEGRQYGDVSTFKSSNGYYIVFYGTRDNNHYQTVNVQQILVKPETIDETLYADDEDTTAYDQAVADAKKAAEDTANKIYQEWIDSGATQDQLTQLTTAYAAQISASDSVLNENVYNGQLPDEVNSWLFDEARQSGDHAVVYTESMGYYILDYIGQGEQYSDMLAETKQRDNDLQAWKDSLTGGEAKATWLMTLTK